jgi:hypothetical protein
MPVGRLIAPDGCDQRAINTTWCRAGSFVKVRRVPMRVRPSPSALILAGETRTVMRPADAINASDQRTGRHHAGAIAATALARNMRSTVD